MNKIGIKKFFNWFVEYNVSIVNASEKYTDEEKKRRLRLIQQKVDHSNRVADKMATACNLAELNEFSRQDYVDLAWIIGLLHDIARPLQMQKTGTYVDNDSYDTNSCIQDHGDDGARVIFDYGLIEKLDASLGLQYILKENVRQHTKFKISENLVRYSDEEIIKLLVSKTLIEILNDNKINEIEILTYFYLRVLRAIDKIDLYGQVISGEVPIVPEFIKYKTLNPKTNKKDSYDAIATTFKIKARDIYEANGIDSSTVDNKKLPDMDILLIPTVKLDASVVNIPLDMVNDFKNNTLPFYRELQKRRDYNFLCATIVRLNFIWTIDCLEVLKLIKKEDLLIKMFNKYPVDYQKKMKGVFDCASTILDNRINEKELKNSFF